MSLEAYEALRRDGYSLAGDLADLSGRARLYYHLYEDSGGRNVFPLIAAHGALWASGYFKKGILLGHVLSLRHLLDSRLRNDHVRSLKAFANRFRSINRTVCAEAYALYFYTKKYRRTPEGIQGYKFKASLVDALIECHESTSKASDYPARQREKLFVEFFSWEQENIVAHEVTAAYEGFSWGTMKDLALRPRIGFSYFGRGHCLKFNDFSSKSERVESGLQAYRRAEDVGLEAVAEALTKYGVMRKAFRPNSASLRSGLGRVPA